MGGAAISERVPHLTVTLVSWVTPHVMTAFVPLMTLWSCGGLVMRVRAADTQAVTRRECRLQEKCF